MSRKPIQFGINPLLSGPTLEARTRLGNPYRELNLSEIDLDPSQPRKEFDTEQLAELAASIKLHGVLCPILVRAGVGGAFRLVAGERRFRACRLIGRETIPAIIDSSPEEINILEKQLIENIQRQDLNAIEKARAIGRLKDEKNLSIRDISSQLGISKSSVQRSLELLELPEDLLAAILAGLPESKILILSRVQDPVVRKELLGRLEELTRDELIEAVSSHSQSSAGEVLSHGGTDGKNGKERTVSDDDRRILDDIQRSLGLKSIISRKKDGKGRLIVEFYSEDDLKAVYDRLVS
jgi:ParB family chromosome partitioning protein